jgi:hypothetical protein
MPLFRSKKTVRDDNKREIERKLVLVGVLTAFFDVALSIKIVDSSVDKDLYHRFKRVEMDLVVRLIDVLFFKAQDDPEPTFDLSSCGAKEVFIVDCLLCSIVETSRQLDL